MAREMQSKSSTYLRIDGKGRLHQGSKEPRDGYELFTSSTGAESYRKYYSGTDYGYITHLGIIEREFPMGNVKFVTLTVENETSRDVIQLPLKKQNGGLNDSVKKLVAVLPGLDYSKMITISSNSSKNERGFIDQVLFFNYVENGVPLKESVKFTLKFGKDGDVPQFEKVQGIDKIEWDYKKQDVYLFEKLMEEIERHKATKISVPTPSSSTPAATTPEKSDSDEKDAEEEEPFVEAPKEDKKASKKAEAKGGPKVKEDEHEDDGLPF